MIAGVLIALGVLMILSCIPMFVYGEYVYAIILVLGILFLIWGLTMRGRKFMCNDEQFEAVGCAYEVKSGYEEIKDKIPSLTLKWDDVKSYSYKAGAMGGYIIVNTQDEKKYHIKIAYLIGGSSGYMDILEQFESKLGTTEKTARQKSKQNTWIAVVSIVAVLLVLLRYILR